MKLQIIAVRDIAANAFSQPQFALSLGHAIRSFGDQAADPNTDIGKHPGDYELYHLGEYDDQDGSFRDIAGTSITNYEKKQIAVGSNYRKRD